MAGFADASLIAPGTELQLTLDGGAVARLDAAAAAALAEVNLGEVLEVGEESETLELEPTFAGARKENLYVAQRLAARVASPPSAQAVYRIVNRAATTAGVPARLCHPHALRSDWATSLLEDGVSVYVVQAGLGHADLGTTGRYAVVRPVHRDELVDVLNRRHQTSRRNGR